MTDNDKSRQITLAEAAELYGFSRIHLRQLAQKGRLNAQKFGNVYVTTLYDVEEYIKSRTRKGAYREDIDLGD